MFKAFADLIFVMSVVAYVLLFRARQCSSIVPSALIDRIHLFKTPNYYTRLDRRVMDMDFMLEPGRSIVSDIWLTR